MIAFSVIALLLFQFATKFFHVLSTVALSRLYVKEKGMGQRPLIVIKLWNWWPLRCSELPTSFHHSFLLLHLPNIGKKQHWDVYFFFSPIWWCADQMSVTAVTSDAYTIYIHVRKRPGLKNKNNCTVVIAWKKSDKVKRTKNWIDLQYEHCPCCLIGYACAVIPTLWIRFSHERRSKSWAFVLWNSSESMSHRQSQGCWPQGTTPCCFPKYLLSVQDDFNKPKIIIPYEWLFPKHLQQRMFKVIVSPSFSIHPLTGALYLRIL